MIYVYPKNIKYINPRNVMPVETRYRDFLKTKAILGIVQVV